MKKRKIGDKHFNIVSQRAVKTPRNISFYISFQLQHFIGSRSSCCKLFRGQRMAMSEAAINFRSPNEFFESSRQTFAHISFGFERGSVIKFPRNCSPHQIMRVLISSEKFILLFATCPDWDFIETTPCRLCGHQTNHGLSDFFFLFLRTVEIEIFETSLAMVKAPEAVTLPIR